MSEPTSNNVVKPSFVVTFLCIDIPLDEIAKLLKLSITVNFLILSAITVLLNLSWRICSALQWKTAISSPMAFHTTKLTGSLYGISLGSFIRKYLSAFSWSWLSFISLIRRRLFSAFLLDWSWSTISVLPKCRSASQYQIYRCEVKSNFMHASLPRYQYCA